MNFIFCSTWFLSNCDESSLFRSSSCYFVQEVTCNWRLWMVTSFCSIVLARFPFFRIRSSMMSSCLSSSSSNKWGESFAESDLCFTFASDMSLLRGNGGTLPKRQREYDGTLPKGQRMLVNLNPKNWELNDWDSSIQRATIQMIRWDQLSNSKK